MWCINQQQNYNSHINREFKFQWVVVGYVAFFLDSWRFSPRSLTRNFIVSVCLSVLMSIEPTSSFRSIFSPGSRGRCHRSCCCCCCSCQPLTHSLTRSLTYWWRYIILMSWFGSYSVLILYIITNSNKYNDVDVFVAVVLNIHMEKTFWVYRRFCFNVRKMSLKK